MSDNNDDDDEVLLAMAEELGAFIPYVGGVDHATVLLPPLETLCSVEETCVRDKAVESLCRIGSQMKESDLVENFIVMVKVRCLPIFYFISVSLLCIIFICVIYVVNIVITVLFTHYKWCYVTLTCWGVCLRDNTSETWT